MSLPDRYSSIYHYPAGACRWCGDPLEGRRRTWCSDACSDEHNVRASPSFARQKVFKRDGGVCALCGLDTERIRRVVGVAEERLHKLERDEYYAQHDLIRFWSAVRCAIVGTQYNNARRQWYEALMYWPELNQPGVIIRQGEALSPTLEKISRLGARVRFWEQRRRAFAVALPKWATATSHAWEADHVVPVWEGGGSCGLGNLRTLCVQTCHPLVTAQSAAKRAASRRDERYGLPHPGAAPGAGRPYKTEERHGPDP